MKAIFPDTKLLQPMPTPNGVHANISGSVNSTTQILPPSLNTQGMQNIPPATQPQSVKKENTFPFFTLWCVIILIIIFAIIFIYKKLKKK